MEGFHSRLRHSTMQMMRQEFNQLNDETSDSNNLWEEITARVVSEDRCIKKIIDFFDKDNTVLESWTTSVFDKALLSLWTDKYFSPQDNDNVFLIASLLQKEMEDVFKENRWIDEKTRERAIEKLRTLTLNVGFPVQILDEERMKSYHEQFLTTDMDPNAFIENQVCFDFSIKEL